MTIDQKALTRPIVGIENRTAQEVFDIMCDRFRLAALPAPDGLVERLNSVLKDYDDDLARTIAAGVLPDRFAFGEDVSGVTYADLREAATALSAASPAPLEQVTVERRAAEALESLRHLDDEISHVPAKPDPVTVNNLTYWSAQLRSSLSAIVGSAK